MQAKKHQAFARWGRLVGEKQSYKQTPRLFFSNSPRPVNGNTIFIPKLDKKVLTDSRFWKIMKKSKQL